ncbi:zinc finger BED domain-containing protein RICESLEEPER 2-like isoform X1 [Magnolia sinica]|uniref:zinc finger BED domain-containing protein RICESLEEPER 2-like isoform X1 n=1 Tax=Magnolia sinica TaxID=86752 RepID=UPI00265B10EE|nr:zinc finger BED domain-containing protein RICESLEEPER 2-like isoform X1 [Magnolia sinica]XP_058082347.1 zinc finger BED domain-containing protein RICESLEEPER 2-like isoform X1 [Magnolia sinica]
MSSRASRTLYVGNLPGDIREREVEDLFYKMTSEEVSTTIGVGASATSPPIVEGKTSLASAKGRKRSPVWDDFEEVVVNGVVKIICVHCKSLYTKNPGGTTTHLNRHRKSYSKRPKIQIPCQQLLPFIKSEGDDSQCLFSTHKFDKDKLKEWYARLVIVEEQPFGIAESKVFVEFCKFLNPQVEKVSCVTVKRECMKMHANEKIKMKAVLASASRISLTSDLWTAYHQSNGYILLNAHYVDEDWKLCKTILNFRYLPPPHIDLVISNCICNCLLEWGIEKKISSITLGDAFANDSVSLFLRNKFKATEIFFFEGKIF